MHTRTPSTKNQTKESCPVDRCNGDVHVDKICNNLSTEFLLKVAYFENSNSRALLFDNLSDGFMSSVMIYGIINETDFLKVEHGISYLQILHGGNCVTVGISLNVV